jgi:hypothetical protein
MKIFDRFFCGRIVLIVSAIFTDLNSADLEIAWDTKVNGSFITDVCRFGNDALVATEDRGLSILHIQQGFTEPLKRAGMLNDHVYAILHAANGRIWIGYGRNGVGVLGPSGATQCALPAYPIGRRIFRIKESPIDKSIWICSEIGLTIFSEDTGEWDLLSFREGIPGLPIIDVGFMPDGDAIIATHADGLVVAHRKSGSHAYSITPAHIKKSIAPDAETGDGLPSNFINKVHVASGGSIWAATDQGLAFSIDGASSWTYICGKDRSEKIQSGKGKPMPSLKQGKTEIFKGELGEDYCTNLSEFEDGRILVAHRRTNPDIIDLENYSIVSFDVGINVPFTTCALQVDNGVILGDYGGGLLTRNVDLKNSKKIVLRKGADSNQTLSIAAREITPDPIKVELTQEKAIRLVKQSKADKPIVPIEDDWETQGQWLGHYGTHWACLCAFCSPDDYIWGPRSASVNYGVWLGPNATADDSVRYWVHWLETEDQRSLEMPRPYLDSRVQMGFSPAQKDRRQSG